MPYKLLYLFLLVLAQVKFSFSQTPVRDTGSNNQNDDEYTTVSTAGKPSVYEPVYEKNKRKVIRGFSFQAENDFFAAAFKLKNEDKDYSGGFKFEFYTDYLAKGIFPFFMNRVDPYSLKYNINSVYVQGLGFTPNREAFGQTSPVTDQRPYSSLLGIGRKRIAVFLKPFKTQRTGDLIIVSDLFLGEIGAKGPGKVQNFLHEYLTNSHLVKGWDNQIANGGKFAYNYNVSASYELFSLSRDTSKHHFIVTTPHISIGNIFVNQGFKLAVTSLRLSRQPFAQTMNSNQKENTDKRVRYYDSKILKFDNKNFCTVIKTHVNYEIYAKLVHVTRNSLLMGLPYYDKSVYKIPKDRINKAVIDAGFKIYYTYTPDKSKTDLKMQRLTTVYFELVFRSKEFDIGPTHIYGGIGVQLLSL